MVLDLGALVQEVFLNNMVLCCLRTVCLHLEHGDGKLSVRAQTLLLEQATVKVACKHSHMQCCMQSHHFHTIKLQVVC